MKGIIYDCEIVKCVPAGQILPRYEYCRGWNDFDGMGISCIGVADLQSGRLWAFSDVVPPPAAKAFGINSLSDFQQLVYQAQKSGEAIWGFNSHKFDDKLCRTNGIAIQTDFDLLEEVRLAAFGSTRWEDQPPGYTYSLDAIARANGMKKTGSGAEAPQWWQDGHYSKVIDYCLNDCSITRELILKFHAGELKDPNTGKILKPNKA